MVILWYGGALDCYSIWGAIKEIDFEDTTDSEEEVRKFEVTRGIISFCFVCYPNSLNSSLPYEERIPCFHN